MSDAITRTQFHEAGGVDDWRVLVDEVVATRFVTGSFAAGVELVDEIGRLADAADHHPDVDLRYGHVTVTLTSHDVGSLSRRDVALARQISQAARARGLEADPGSVQTLSLGLDALVLDDVKPFWRALLAYDEAGPRTLVDPAGRGTELWFQQMDEARTQRGRFHLDVLVPHDQAQARIDAALGAGGVLVTDAHAPAWWVLADAEGNEACVCTWQGRD